PASDLKPVDLAELAQRTVEKALPSLDPSRIRLEFSQPGRRALVEAAPEQIQQVILNLIQNSANALEGRSDGRISVYVQFDDVEADGPGGEVTAVVQDNGKGIKKEHLEKL